MKSRQITAAEAEGYAAYYDGVPKRPPKALMVHEWDAWERGWEQARVGHAVNSAGGYG